MESRTTTAEPTRDGTRRKRIWRWISVVGALCLYELYCWVWLPFRAERCTFQGDSSTLQQTVIVPTLDSPLPSGKNAVWCASFQASWDQLRLASNGTIQQPPTLLGAETITKRLNSSSMPLTDLPQTSYFAGGLVKNGIIPTIQSAMRHRFPNIMLPAFRDLNDSDIIAYGYLEAAVKFPIPFFDAAPMIFAGIPVVNFGIRGKDKSNHFDMRRQVHVLYYSKDEYIIDPCYTSSIQVVLARIKPGASLAVTIKASEKKMTSWANPKDEYKIFDRLSNKQHLTELEMAWMEYYINSMNAGIDRLKFGSDDILLIPNMRWVINHRFSELEGKQFIPARSSYYLKDAQQTVSFTLNRSGVNLLSSAILHDTQGCPRRFIFDHPFLLYMRLRDHKQPFFAMWVDNAELLTKM